MSLGGHSGFSECIPSYIKPLGIKARAICSLILTHLTSFCNPSHFILATEKQEKYTTRCKVPTGIFCHKDRRIVLLSVQSLYARRIEHIMK